MSLITSNLKAQGLYKKPVKASCVRAWECLPQSKPNINARIVARDVLIVTVSGSFFGNVKGNGRVVGKKNLIVKKQSSGNYMQIGI